MKISTPRLELTPLTLEQFDLLLKDSDKLDNEVRVAFEWLYKQCKAHPEHHIWFTDWQIISKKEKAVVGNFCFKGEPDFNGEVEIGYGIDEKFQNNGYMSETIEAICKWAKKQKNVKAVIAETDKDNPASHKVLQNNGFEKYRETGGAYWWKIKLN